MNIRTKEEVIKDMEKQKKVIQIQEYEIRKEVEDADTWVEPKLKMYEKYALENNEEIKELQDEIETLKSLVLSKEDEYIKEEIKHKNELLAVKLKLAVDADAFVNGIRQRKSLMQKELEGRKNELEEHKRKIEQIKQMTDEEWNKQPKVKMTKEVWAIIIISIGLYAYVLSI